MLKNQAACFNLNGGNCFRGYWYKERRGQPKQDAFLLFSLHLSLRIEFLPFCTSAQYNNYQISCHQYSFHMVG